MTELRVWMDDLRDPVAHAADPSSWTWVKTVQETIALLETGQVVELSLDNDLGQDADGRDLPEGHTLVLWLAEHDVWPRDGITVHSDNSVAAEKMCRLIDHYNRGRYGRRLGGARRFTPAR